AFSVTHPFTLHRQRHGVFAKYHFDGVLGDKPREVGWDGESAWWRDGWTGNPEWARKMGGSSLAVALQDAEMPTPLFDWREKGYMLELLGPDELEGLPTLKLKLTRSSGEEETWHLDAETYLEVARDAVCDEFGRGLQGRMFFDDFRTIGAGTLGRGVVIPFYTEVEWRTRHRVMQVDSAEVNVKLDPALFAPPPPPGMADLLKMAGTWKVEGQRRPGIGAPFRPFEASSEITTGLERTVLEERRTPESSEVWNTWAYDRFHDVYRQTAADDNYGRINVLEGKLGDDGRIVLDNLKSGTTLTFGPTTVHERRILHEITDDSFRLDLEVSIDGGETW
ncbi:MAG: hypothetical protein MI919_10800, partial [Holophagales bacterium]|nr:hypothetical protein [Holophagales bacterium]